MGRLANTIIDTVTFGAVDDALGLKRADAATQQAAEVQAQASEQAIGEQRRQFDISQQNIQPFQQAGVSALEQQQELLNDPGSFQESPGQRFLRERGERSLLRNQAAIGGLGGGNVRSALQQQGIGFAAQDFNNQFSRLGQVAGQGQTAVQNINAMGQNVASNIGQFGQRAAEARASGLLGTAQNNANLTSQLLNLGAQGFGASMGGK